MEDQEWTPTVGGKAWVLEEGIIYEVDIVGSSVWDYGAGEHFHLIYDRNRGESWRHKDSLYESAFKLLASIPVIDLSGESVAVGIIDKRDGSYTN